MTRTSSTPVGAFALLACMLSACLGTSTGNPDNATADAGKSGEGTLNGGTFAQCDATTSELPTLDTKSKLGFSGNDVLALAGRQHTTSMEWLGSNELSITPAVGLGTLHIGIAPKAVKARFVQLDMKKGDGADLAFGINQPGGDACPDRVEVDVQVTLKSDDGGFDEAFDATLVAENTRVVSFTHTIDAKQLGGSLTVHTQGALAAFTLQSVQVDTTFSALGSSGTVMPTLVSESDGGTSASTSAGGVGRSGGGLARWPAGAACDAFTNFGTRGVPRALDATFGNASANDAIAQVNAAGALTLAWQKAPATSLQVKFTPDGTSACASYGGSAADMVQLEVAGKLAAKSADGRIDASWPTFLTAYFGADDKLDHVEVASDPNGGIVTGLVDVKDFTRTYGITGVDVSAYDQANALLSVSWNVGTSAAVAGSLTVQGAKLPMCATEKPAPEPAPDAGSASSSGSSSGSSGGSSSACQGIDLHTVEMASITGQ